jgi:CheY-like chemotaxis protein
VNILIVDDEDGNRISLGLVLRALGHTVDEAHNGAVALENIGRATAPFDLIITDNVMPKMSGLQLIEELRRSKFQGEIMAVSANLRPAEEEKLRSLGVRFVVEKPFGLDVLRSAVAECTELQQAGKT